VSICVVLCDVKVTSCLRMHAHSSHVCLYRKDSSQRRCVELSAQFRKYYFRTVRQVAAPEETFAIFNCPYNTHTHTHTHTHIHTQTHSDMYVLHIIYADKLLTWELYSSHESCLSGKISNALLLLLLLLLLSKNAMSSVLFAYRKLRDT